MLQLPATLMHHTAKTCLAELQQALQATPETTVKVNLAALQRFDSTALAVLLELSAQAQRVGKKLVLQAMPSRLNDLARVYGIDALLPAAN